MKEIRLQELVYGDALGSLVFLTRTRAEELSKVGEMIQREPTWGEFRAQMSVRIREEVKDWYPADALPDDNEPFDASWIYDGDWPFPHQEQIALLPKDVLALGSIEATTFNGDRLDLPYAAEADIVQRLRDHGYGVERDDRLIRLACCDV
jgi:hypothetical protein